MRVVFDTNVIVAGLVVEGLCREIVEFHLPEHTAILSEVLWDELVRVLRAKFGLSADELPLLQLYRRHAVLLQPEPLTRRVSRDPDDDWVLATALAGAAELVVTGDDDLLSLQSFEGIRIVGPREFLESVGR